MTAHTDAPAPQRRAWWPALIGAGLTAAAVVGVVALRSDDTDNLTPSTPSGTSELQPGPQPTATNVMEPSTTLVPSTTLPGLASASVATDGPCITISLGDASSTGCPQTGIEFDQLDQRVFVADLDGPVIAVSASADPFTGLSAAVDENGDLAARCRWEELAARIPAGGLVELVVCDSTGVMGLDVAGLVNTGNDQQTGPPTYFTLPTPSLPDGADLGPGRPVDGWPGALAFTAPVEDVTTCSLLLLPDRTGWKEACGFIHGLELTTALVQTSRSEPVLHEISVDETGLIRSARALEAMAPSSGCAPESANDLLRTIEGSSIVMGIGCIDDKAALVTGSVLTQDGPPDGMIVTALRENGVWTVTNAGTDAGIDASLAFPIAPSPAWEAWPESTVPTFRSYWWESIIAIPALPTVEAFADELLAALGSLDTEPEFPLNERVVEIRPAGLPLIIAQVDTGGDDSVAGAVLYVWLEEEYDDSGPIGWRAKAILTGDVCARGDTLGRELCI